MLETKDRYEGLSDEVAQALKDGKMVKGLFRDKSDEEWTVDWMYEYRKSSNYPYIGERTNYKQFKIHAKRKTKDVRTLIKHGVEIPVDTPVICWDDKIKHKEHFRSHDKDTPYAWSNGRTSFTAYSSTDYEEWRHMELLYEMEY